MIRRATLAFVVVLVAVVLVPTAALAKAPTVEEDHQVFEFIDPFLTGACGFEVAFTVDRHVKTVTFDDSNTTRHIRATLTATAADGGPTLVNRQSYKSRQTESVVEEDGFLIAEFIAVDTGKIDDWRGPGFRYKQSGKRVVSGGVVVDLSTGETVEESFSIDSTSGRFDEFIEAEFCEALAS